MNKKYYIVIRKEYKLNETRVAITPIDCFKLIKYNYIVYVEKSNNRCFSDNIYQENGCILIDSMYSLQYNIDEMLIIGLKELPDDDIIYKFYHIYFSHTFKNQLNSEYILNKFKLNNGRIYDLEYFRDIDNNRLFAFGKYAGVVGCYLGLLQYYNKLVYNINIKEITSFNSFDNMIKEISKCKTFFNNIRVGVIGNGRCGKGCIILLELLNIKYDIITRINNYNLTDYDIILNNILLTSYINPFITTDTLYKFIKPCVIVDISCDYNNPFNPLPIYNRLSTFIEPVIDINNMISMIAIDNLPSLLPCDSSSDFSSKLVSIMCSTKFNMYMDNTLKYFYKTLLVQLKK